MFHSDVLGKISTNSSLSIPSQIKRDEMLFPSLFLSPGLLKWVDWISKFSSSQVRSIFMCCKSSGYKEVKVLKSSFWFTKEVKKGSIFNQGNTWLPKMGFALELKLFEWESVWVTLCFEKKRMSLNVIKFSVSTCTKLQASGQKTPCSFGF